MIRHTIIELLRAYWWLIIPLLFLVVFGSSLLASRGDDRDRMDGD